MISQIVGDVQINPEFLAAKFRSYERHCGKKLKLNSDNMMRRIMDHKEICH